MKNNNFTLYMSIVAVFLLLLLTNIAFANSVYCKSTLITEGSSVLDLESCGEPDLDTIDTKIYKNLNGNGMNYTIKVNNEVVTRISTSRF